MQTIPVGELHQHDFNLNHIFSMFQTWGEHSVFSTLDSPRKPHGLLYYNACTGDYINSDGSRLTAHRGDIIYLPSGAKYKTTFVDTEKNNPSTILIDFSIFDQENKPFRLSEKVFRFSLHDGELRLSDAFREIAVLYESPVVSQMMLKSHLFRLLSELCGMERHFSLFSNQYQTISKGIQYLEEDTEQTLSIDEIAKLCNVSGNCFRKLFKSYAGVSPNEFRIGKKIERAQKLLASGTLTVSETADLLHFEDAAYFSRLFKRKTGVSPGSFCRRENRNGATFL